MAYQKKHWIDEESELTAEDLNKYELTLEGHDNKITEHTTKLAQHENTFAEHQNILTQCEAAITEQENKLNEHIEDNATHNKYIEGVEYLSYYHEKLRTNQPVKLVFSGDSTTYGAGLTDTNYTISNLAKQYLNKCGYPRVTSINAGHNNMNVQAWINQYLNEDLEQNPDLYVIRWGFNHDGTVNLEQRVANFERDLRIGLDRIRANRTADQLSVILMMPNSGNDTTYHRDKEWFDAIYPVVKKAARDYQCCFVDTYHYLYDSTNVTWQDTPMGDGVTHIHPLERGNVWIISLLSETLIPVFLRHYGITNVLSSDFTTTATTPPSYYKNGLSIHRTDLSFPYNGNVYTIKSADGIVTQINTSFQAVDANKIAFRQGLALVGVSGGIGDNAWGGWIRVRGTTEYIPLELRSGWENNSADDMPLQYFIDASNTVHIKGMIKGGDTSLYSTLFTMPVGARPAKNFYNIVLTSGGIGTIIVQPYGPVKVISVPNNGWVAIDISYKAEQ